MSEQVVWLDLETASVDDRWSMPPEQYIRLGGYSWNLDNDVTLTTDVDELREVVRSADVCVAYNGHSFDWSVLFGVDSTEPLELALGDHLFDPMVHATLVHPAPRTFVDRNGVVQYITSPDKAKRWFKLDEQAYQLGVPGKTQDLQALADEFGGFDKIPVTDRRFRAYLTQDVRALRAVTERLMRLGPIDTYAKREQVNAAIDAQNARNGWLVDQPRARHRVAEQEREKARILAFLERTYGFPTTGKAPLRTNAGKAATLKALADVGISEDELPRTDNGAPSLAGKGLIKVAKRHNNDEALQLAQAIAQIGGLRPLAQQALDHVQPDGKVHPEITTLQRSGRKSTTKPGLTTWSARDPRMLVEKSYFIADPGFKIVEFDYSQADARIVAAMSGDEEFAKRFAPGVDAHLLTAQIVWGEDVVGHDKNDPVTAEYRFKAKGMNHAYAYRAGPRTLAENAGVPLADAEQFVSQMQRAYRLVTKWQQRATKEGRRGSVLGAWGRRMLVDRDREFTQAPALLGQNGTREIVVDALISMAREDIRSITYLLAQVHDALAFQFPEHEVDYWIAFVKRHMETTWQPPDGSGMPVHFPVSVGAPADNWMLASH